ncbi:tryptophan-rich sensory protein [Devosia sp.]|uniref:tryptophan-rich sensory protein n=1 Tax=Devosia sp. TaxID=1871048 RepID=UPI002FC6C20D
MATSNTVSKRYLSVLDADRHNALGLVLSAALPLAVFVIANGIAELNGFLPLFFSPLGLPGWFGAALHLGALPLFGIARWMVAAHGPAGRRAGWWVVGLIAGTIAFPFLATPLDSLILALVAFGLLAVGLGTMVRVAAVDARAALVMVPGLAWMGFSAFVGLSFAAGWSPPFAVTNSQAAA